MRISISSGSFLSSMRISLSILLLTARASSTFEKKPLVKKENMQPMSDSLEGFTSLLSNVEARQEREDRFLATLSRADANLTTVTNRIQHSHYFVTPIALAILLINHLKVQGATANREQNFEGLQLTHL